MKKMSQIPVFTLKEIQRIKKNLVLVEYKKILKYSKPGS